MNKIALLLPGEGSGEGINGSKVYVSVIFVALKTVEYETKH